MNKFLACFVLIAILSCASADGSFWGKLKTTLINSLDFFVNHPVEAINTIKKDWNFIQAHPLETAKIAYVYIKNSEVVSHIHEALKEIGVNGYELVCKRVFLKNDPEACKKQKEQLRDFINN